MTETLDQVEPDLTQCDREPIHIPGSIQPHGFMLVLDLQSLTIRQGAGLIEDLTGRNAWIDRPVGEVLSDVADRRIRSMAALQETGFACRWRATNRLEYDVIVHMAPSARSGLPSNLMIIEVEQSSQQARLGVDLVASLDAAGAALERAPTVQGLCERAAEAFRRLTGFDRVMIYRFQDDEAGEVVAEARAEGAGSFLNHHFPATDIPRQARALYLRNPVRVIPDSRYTPQPLRPVTRGETPLDMSDSGLRSVSPIHLQYLQNMDVRASASVSIIVDDALWGLVACHNASPKLLPFELRVGCTTLARNLARQLKAKGDAELYRDRTRLRRLEDQLVARLPADRPLAAALADRAEPLMQLTGADGLAIVSEGAVRTFGHTPPVEGVRAIADWVAERPGLRPVSSHALSTVLPEARAWTTHGSGLLAVNLPVEQPLSILWFRAEVRETVRWAGNPATADKSAPNAILTPRASFESWSEEVAGRAKRWGPAAIESAGRLRDTLADYAAIDQLRRLNRSLQTSLSERDLRLEQQQYLIREVNHRVQNSLTLVSSFLGLQAREQTGGAAATALNEARRRVRAVSAVHSLLYRGDTATTVDMARYIGELIDDLTSSMGPDWAAATETDLAPICIDAGRAVTIGLILTELIINAQKYAYKGKPGPLRIAFEEDGAVFRLRVEDEGEGGHLAGKGFGSMMIQSLVGQLEGVIDYRDRDPGLSVTLKARIDPLV
ncbi:MULTISPECIES: histidine kinase dimerization/phosphoacceptor domain -containing protein [unclassified Brevundimonas]|uniref:histidine kinase dimerization/phosphoacceptor domain -containing protein n=1 Tax=unclassified Brevundimonas TaxID=2622653 RepID=UPI0025BB6ECB|nr:MULTISPECIES: histidine kinase dimerization/phosphoacceptor domain -containing protein [unclassified Brevundimonas]